MQIQFIKDFATKKKGDVWECDSQHAARLINEGVANKVKKVVRPKKSE